MSKKIKILNTEVINDNKKSNNHRSFLRLTKKKLVYLTISLLLIISLLLVPRDYYKASIRKILALAGIYTEEIKQVEIESNDYDDPGSFKITKSAKWLSTNKVQITFDIDSVLKTGDNYKDIILVLDNSGSMSGEKLTKAINDSKDLVNTLLSDNHNRIALITFNSTSQVLSTFTNNKETILELLDNISTEGSTNYNVALQNIDAVMTDYVKNNDTDVVALFLTDGYPNEGTPSEVAQYSVLKDKYPYLTINGVQYEMGKDLIDEIKSISDNQFVADKATLNNVLIEASISPETYEEFIIEDYINTDYFNITSTDDIKTSIGTATIDDATDEKKIVWNLGDNSYVTGSNKTMTINLTLNDTLPSNKTFYPTNTKEVITYKLGAGEEQTITSTDTPVLTNKYNVIYDNNTPDGCVIENNINSDEYLVYSTVSKSTNQLTCSGYHFRGWKIPDEQDKDITHINEDLFIMPGHDVTVRAEWSNQSITKSVDGTVNTHATLYKVLKDEAESGGLAMEYTGEHQDSMDETKSTEKIYHWYATNDTQGTQILDKNNVVFGGQCWQMIRTTDTGGVKMIYNGEVVDNQCLSTRGAHVGYGGRAGYNDGYTTRDLSSNYWYGTDYSYDNINKEFSLIGTLNQSLWNSSTASSLIGKYTCRSTTENGTCSSLFLVDSYVNDTSANVYIIRTDVNYPSIGNVAYSSKRESLSYVGYMYEDVYSFSKTTGTTSQDYEKIESLFELTYLGTSYWYADSISYDSTSGKYSLVNPYQVSGTTDYPNLVGKYTFRSSNQTNTATNVYYIAAVNNTTMYYKQLQSGNLLSAYEPIVFGDTITDNGDGTYTINNPTNVTLADWYTNYDSYKNKYTCNDSSTTCTNPRYITDTNSRQYKYFTAGVKIMIGKARIGLNLTDTLLVTNDELIINSSNYGDYKYTCNTDSTSCTEATLRMITGYHSSGYTYAPNHYYGSSVTWDGTNYTLVDPIEIENYNNINAISTHHYICPNYGEKVCSSIGYIYYYSGSNSIEYILFQNGMMNPSLAIENMLTKNTTSSTVKKSIDEWYKHYLLKYNDYIDDIIFCNDRSIRDIAGWDPNGKTTSELNFKESSITRDLNCNNITDQFSISNPSARLTYKVGLPTAPELFLLGNNNVRKSSLSYHTMSADDFSMGAVMKKVQNDGRMTGFSGGVINYSYSVRPVIALIPGTEYYTGDGSMEHPYIVDLGE